MGAGRKTQTITGGEMPFTTVQARNLLKNDLGGMVFGCTHTTMAECLSKKIFGLPSHHYSYVRNVTPGLPLFLFSYSNRKLYGIYVAESNGELDIDPHAWIGGEAKTHYPAQVRFSVKAQCQPLVEDQYSKILKENYYTDQHFMFELDKKQTKSLIALFKTSPCKEVVLPYGAQLASASAELPTTNLKVTENAQEVKPEAAERKCWKSYTDALKGTQNLKLTDSAIENISGFPGSSAREIVHDNSNVSSSIAPEFDNSEQVYANAVKSNKYCKSYMDVVKGAKDHLEPPRLLHENRSRSLGWDDGETQIAKSGDSSFASAEDVVSDWEVHADVDNEDIHENITGGIQQTILPCTNKEDQIFEEHSFTADGLKNHERVLLKLKNLATAREVLLPPSECYNDDDDVPASPSDSLGTCKYPSNDMLNVIERQDASNSCCQQGNPELIQMIENMTEQYAKLEKEQVESKREIQQLWNVVENTKNEVVQLKEHIKELESKFDPFTALVDDSMTKFIGQYFGQEKVIYIIGGFNGSHWLSDLDSFSPSHDVLTPLKPMSCSRSFAFATSLGDSAYVFGGHKTDLGSFCYNTVECYNPSMDEWTLCPAMKRERGNLGGAALDGKIFVIGGGTSKDCHADVEMFDPANGRWVNAQIMLEKRLALATVEVHGAVYAVGGFDGKDYLQTAERYDPREPYWRRIPSMTVRRACHSLAVLNNKLYAIGGYDGFSMIPSCETLDPRAGSWEACDPLNGNRGRGAAVAFGDSLVIFGGLQDNNTPVDTVEIFKDGVGWAVSGIKSIGQRCFFSTVMM